VIALRHDEPVDVRRAGLDEAWLEAETPLTSGPPVATAWVLPPWAAQVHRHAAQEQSRRS